MAFAKKLLLVSLSIFALTVMSFIPKKSDRAIDIYQSENPVNHASESEDKVYELQQQLKRSLEMETLPTFADKKVAKHNKLEKIDEKWLLSKLGLNLIKTQTYLMTIWQQHLSPTLKKVVISENYPPLISQNWIPSIRDKSVTPDLIKQFDVSYYYLEIYGKWFLSKLGLNLNKTQAYLMTLWQQHLSLTLEKKWIPSIKRASVITYLEPKFHYLTDKSIEVLYKAKRVLTPDLIQEFDVSFYYLEANRIMIIAKLHIKKKVQVSLESCTGNVRHGFKKLVNLGRKKIRKVTQRAFCSG